MKDACLHSKRTFTLHSQKNHPLSPLAGFDSPHWYIFKLPIQNEIICVSGKVCFMVLWYPGIFSINRSLVTQSVIGKVLFSTNNGMREFVIERSYLRMWFLKFRVGIFPTHNKFCKCMHSTYLLVTPVTSDRRVRTTFSPKFPKIIKYLPEDDLHKTKTVPLKSDSHRPKIFIIICFNVSPSKMMKNAFYFILKALFVLKIFKFLSWLFGHVEKRAWLERYD